MKWRIGEEDEGRGVSQRRQGQLLRHDEMHRIRPRGSSSIYVFFVTLSF